MRNMQRSGKDLGSIVSKLACDIWGVFNYLAFDVIEG